MAELRPWWPECPASHGSLKNLAADLDPLKAVPRLPQFRDEPVKADLAHGFQLVRRVADPVELGQPPGEMPCVVDRRDHGALLGRTPPAGLPVLHRLVEEQERRQRRHGQAGDLGQDVHLERVVVHPGGAFQAYADGEGGRGDRHEQTDEPRGW